MLRGILTLGGDVEGFLVVGQVKQVRYHPGGKDRITEYH